ncbi:MAG: hypothetical protein M1281_06235 [Chloroflexi bacterium]|nr:hypothetical protein [Chloroflexota bacterium]
MGKIRHIEGLAVGMIALLSLGGCVLIWLSTPWGPWAFSDSAGYVSTARNFVLGNGFGYFYPSGRFQLLSVHAPLYPLLLSVPVFMGWEPVDFARWLDILLFGLTIFWLAGAFYVFTRSLWGALAGGILVLLAPSLVNDFTSMMTEPVFIFCGYAGLIFGTYYLISNRRGYLLLAALFSSFACLSRYIGVAFIMTIGLSLLLLSSQPWKRRIGDAAAYGLLSSLPVAVFLLWENLQNSSIGGRLFRIDAAGIARIEPYLRKVLETVARWVPFYDLGAVQLHPGDRVLALAAGGLTLTALAFWKLRSLSDRQPVFTLPAARWLFMLIFFVVSYLLSLGVSYCFSSLKPTMDGRMLSPALPAAIFAVVGALTFTRQAWPASRWIPYAGTAAVLVCAAFYGMKTAVLIQPYTTDGIGFTSRVWRQSQAFAALRSLPPGTLLISNDPDLVLFYTDRYPLNLAEDIYWQSSPQARLFGDGNGEIQTAFRQGAALALFFPQMRAEVGDQMQARLQDLTQGMQTAYLGPEMGLYFYPSTFP